MALTQRWYMNNIVIILPEEYKPEAKDCPVCEKALPSLKDVMNNRKWGCCLTCDVIYRYPNREKWEEGWRPDNYKQKGDVKC